MPSTLHRTSTPQLVKASGTAADPYILENMDIDVRTLSNAGLTLLNAQHILVRNVRIRHAPHAVGIQLINSHHARFANVWKQEKSLESPPCVAPSSAATT